MSEWKHPAFDAFRQVRQDRKEEWEDREERSEKRRKYYKTEDDEDAEEPKAAEIRGDGNAEQKEEKEQSKQDMGPIAVPPSLRSTGHFLKQCKPCRFFWTKAGCRRHADCTFCHHPHDNTDTPGEADEKARRTDKEAWSRGESRAGQSWQLEGNKWKWKKANTNWKVWTKAQGTYEKVAWRSTQHERKGGLAKWAKELKIKRLSPETPRELVKKAFREKGFDSVQFSFPEGKNYGFVICESEAQASLILRTPITMGWTVLRMKRSRREEPAQPDDEVPYWTMMDGYYGEWWP